MSQFLSPSQAGGLQGSCPNRMHAQSGAVERSGGGSGAGGRTGHSSGATAAAPGASGIDCGSRRAGGSSQRRGGCRTDCRHASGRCSNARDAWQCCEARQEGATCILSLWQYTGRGIP